MFQFQSKLLQLFNSVISKLKIIKTKGVRNSKILKKSQETDFTLRKLKCFKKYGGSVSCRYLYRFDELPSNIPSNVVIVPTDNVKVKKKYFSL